MATTTKLTIKQLSELLFLKFQQEFPQAAGKSSGSKKNLSEKNIDQRLKRFHDAARKFRNEHRLGIIDKARLALELQSIMLNAGYPSGLVRQIIFSLVLNSLVGK